MMQDDRNTQEFGLLAKQITRRDAIKAGGIAAVGLAFSKPLIETIYPKPAFAGYLVTDPPLKTQFCPDGVRPRALGMRYVGGNELIHTQDGGKAGVPFDAPLNAPESVKIIATQEGTPGKVFFEGEVDLGAVFFIDADNIPGEDKLDSSTEIFIYDVSMTTLLQRIIFHTSCSQDLALGNQFGGLVVAGYLSHDGSTTAGIQPPPPPPPPAVAEGEVILVPGSLKFKKGGKHLVLKLENTSDSEIASINEIVIGWPVGNGKLKKIKAAGKSIFDPMPDIPQSSSPLTVTSFIGNSSLRRFGAGSVVELKFEFQDATGVSLGDYDLNIDFGAEPKTLEQILPAI